MSRHLRRGNAVGRYAGLVSSSDERSKRPRDKWAARARNTRAAQDERTGVTFFRVAEKSALAFSGLALRRPVAEIVGRNSGSIDFSVLWLAFVDSRIEWRVN